ncbi:MAG: DUF3500 domain-containing protein [Sciscionella sp.]
MEPNSVESDGDTRESATRMARAATNWLDSLRPAQREHAVRPWPSERERLRWYYTPTDHGGLPIGQMVPDQQRMALRLVSTGLSRPAYVTTCTIMGLENVLDQVEGWQVDWGRERGRDPGLYYLRVFGEPGGSEPWSWRFGGHHVSLHHLVFDGEVQASTPCFLGADPAAAPLLGGRESRPLGGAEDIARDLVNALDPDQRARAVLTDVAPVDIVSGNRARIGDGDRVIPLPDLWRGYFSEPRLRDRVREMHRRGEEIAGTRPADHEAVKLTTTPRGLAAREMATTQQHQLRDLIEVYIGRMPDALADREAAKVAGEHLGAVHFAWAGGTEPGEPHYYRLQGPRLLAEYDNTQRAVNHVHTVWRDPERDFGLDPLAAHYAEYHRG